MRKRKANSIDGSVFLTIEQACEYLNMGRAFCMKWCEEIGALRRFTARQVRVDKVVLDRTIEKLREER